MRALFALFIRSVREDCRAKLPLILRTALVVIILLVLWGGHREFERSAAGQDLLTAVMVINGCILGVAALSIFPSAITEEKEDETLPLLRMTNLSALSILMGKGGPRLLSALLLLAVQIPFTLLAITLGGVSMTQVLGSYAILGAVAFFLCALSLLASVFCKTAIRAGFLTAILAGLLYVGTIAICELTARRMMRGMPAPQPVTPWEHVCLQFIEINPVYGLRPLLEPRGGRVIFIQEVVWHNLGAGLLCIVLAWLIFDRYCSQLGETVSRPKPVAAGRPRRRWAHVSRAWRWPLVWKDFYFMVGGRFGFFLRCGLALLVFGGAFVFVRFIDQPYARYASFSYSDDRDYYFYVWRGVSEIVLSIAACVAGLELLLIASRIFGVERRRLTLSSLVALPWTTGRIIRQKVMGCLPAFLPWVLLAVAGVAVYWQEISRELGNLSEDLSEIGREEMSVLLYVGLQGMLFLVTIVWFSLRIRRGSLPAAIAVMAVWNILFAICVDGFGHRNEADVLFAGVFLTVPALIYMGRAVYQRIETSAAEE
jgi:hypothetical protein